jgi:hypothetical protein
MIGRSALNHGAENEGKPHDCYNKSKFHSDLYVFKIRNGV